MPRRARNDPSSASTGTSVGCQAQLWQIADALRDPLPGSTGNPQSLNSYPYVQNNPVNREDPSGMLSEGGDGCQTDELLAAYFLGLAGFFGVVLPGAFLLSNPATFALGVALLEYVALPIEVASVILIAHACGVQLL